jgi:hypothetical protein
MRQVFFFIVLINSAACSQNSDKVVSTIFSKGVKLGEVVNPKLSELSGLAASVNNPGLLWTHNDSGNSAEVFLIDKNLDIKLTCRLKNIVNRDWEDIAVGPGPVKGKSYIYVGDIGDNLAIFPYKTIYRFEEPILSGSKEIVISKFDAITFALEGIKKDAESLMVNPHTKDIYIISKWQNPESLYQLKYPYSTKDTITASFVMTIPFTRVVAADFSGDGSEIIMKTYKDVYYWKVKDKPVKVALSEPPFKVEYKQEAQGESITFANDGSGFFTVSESNKKTKTYLYFYPRNNN